MPRARLHIPIDGETGEVGRALCGRPAVLLGEPPDCAQCLRALKSAARPARVTWSEVVYAIAHLLAGPPVEPIPPLTREAWRVMDCRRGEVVETDEECYLDARRITPRAWADLGYPASALRCRCPICEAESASLGAAANWEAEQQHRPHQRHACDFGSRDAALQFLARWRLDGASTRSSAGAVSARMEESARLGTAVQTTQRFDRDDLPTRRAQQATDVERALRRAFAEGAERRGLTSEQCVAIMLTTVTERTSAAAIGERVGLSAAAVRRLIAHGRRVVTIELAASGYIPEPRAETGLVEAVRKRRVEMGESE